MTEDIHSHLKAIQAWLAQVDQSPVPEPSAKGLSPEEKQQLQAVNKAVEQLNRLGVQIPSDLRSLKLSLSANDVVAVANPQVAKQLGSVEDLIQMLRELTQSARALRDKLKTGTKGSTSPQRFSVSLVDLLDAELISIEDRLELQWSKDSGVFHGKVLSNGCISAHTPQGWKTFDSLSMAAVEISGRNQNGWEHWRRIGADGTRTALKEIRAEYLNQANES